MAYRAYPKNGKYRYNIAGREPWALPKDEILIPDPPELPNAPSSVSLLTMILPPAVMIAGSVISVLVSGSVNLVAILPMMLMGLGYPAANLISHNIQKKKYKEKLAERKAVYTRSLRECQSRIEGLIEKQRSILQTEFPPIQQTLNIGLEAGANKHLWWRKPNEIDFLNLRIGSGGSPISFTITPPRAINPKDPLSEMPFELIERYEQVGNMPMLVDLKRLGSLAVYGPSFAKILRLVRRLLVDVLVHHSPENISIFVLANRMNAAEEWEWLKWAPHCHLIEGGQERQSLLFTADKINTFLDDLVRIFFERLETKHQNHNDDARDLGRSIIVVFDDEDVRSHQDIRRIAEQGKEVGIYLIFVTDHNVPSSCGVRIEITASDQVNYLEYVDSQSSGNRQIGRAELAQKAETEPLTRALAGLEQIGGQASVALPNTVRVVDLIPGDPYSVSDLVENWKDRPEDSQQVLLPVGQYVGRDGLATYEIDFRPESLGGKGAYHAMMIGTTGSGKSIFMQSLVLAAAHRYSPRDINFMFMDFKAGAAELKKVSEIPHSVGMVTDLSPKLADRALQALENELSRRKQIFDNAGNITDIWDFNRRFPDQRIPHLMVMIDEFAEGKRILPNLVERLKELGRQGRAFGMYFFLANQEVNSEVEALKANVSWYILLKVNRQDEVNFIERRLQIPPGRGRGYIKVKSDVISVQGAYAGLPANVGDQDGPEVTEFLISTFGPEGQKNEIFRYDPRRLQMGKGEIQSELELLLATIKGAAYELNIPKPKPIYTKPLPPVIPLSKLLESQETYRLFDGKDWPYHNGERNTASLGHLDIPTQCIQPPFSLNFNGSGGHLWIVGMPGSGKDLVTLSLASSLCYTHRPDELNLYVLEFGAGQLSSLAQLPHTGAIIRAHEKERINRLLFLLQETLRERADSEWQLEGKPEIYVIVNNIADLYIQNPDQAHELGRFIRSGGSVGIHLIITSNRVSELPRALSGNISNRIVLQLADNQEYLDVLGRRMPELTLRTPGRGYLVREGEVAECQVAVLDSSLINGINTEAPSPEQKPSENDLDIQSVTRNICALSTAMQCHWTGEQVKPVDAMSDILTLNTFEKILDKTTKPQIGVSIPIGLDFQKLSPLYSDLRKDGPFWTILGSRQNGKSNFLLSMIYHLDKDYPNKVQMTLIPFRRGPLSRIVDTSNRRLIMGADQIIETCSQISEDIQNQPDTMHIVLMDDLGIAYSSGNSALVSALNQLGDQLNILGQDNFMVVIADLYSNLKTSQTYNSSFLKLFQQSQAGIFFSKDDSDMQWFNTPISLQQKKALKILPGRGFFVSQGKAEFIQTPLLDINEIS